MDAGIFYALAIHAIIIGACWISEVRAEQKERARVARCITDSMRDEYMARRNRCVLDKRGAR